MSEANVVVTGYVGKDPVLNISEQSGVRWTSFRIGSTPRVRHVATGEWRDGTTTWYTVKVFGRAAQYVTESVRQGHPVIVTGRLTCEEWVDADGRERHQLSVVAQSLGPDTTRGLTRYTKAVIQDRAPGEEPVPGEDGPTSSADDPWQTAPDEPTSDDGVPEPEPELASVGA